MRTWSLSFAGLEQTLVAGQTNPELIDLAQWADEEFYAMKTTERIDMTEADLNEPEIRFLNKLVRQNLATVSGKSDPPGVL